MLCGAGDVKELHPMFVETAKEMGFTPLNFTDGSIFYHNYGVNQWERNSKLTVRSSDILVFVINEKYGEITWNTELDEAIGNGKNFIVLCRDETYAKYRYHKDERLEYPTDPNKRNLFVLLDKIETVNQLSVIPFNIFDFKAKVKEHMIKLFRFALTLTEKENQKNSFLPVLMSSKYNNLLPNQINELNEKICRGIVFDFFENKETRKRALEYFKYSKSLSDDEISELCADMEQGLKRKTISILTDLLGSKNNLDELFENIITNMANDDDDVGVIRRAIKSLTTISLERTIKHFHLFFPASDVGTPKRIISNLKEKENELDKLLSEQPELIPKFVQLVDNCIN